MPAQSPTDAEVPGPQVGGSSDYGAELEAWALGLDDDLATRESNALAAEDDLEAVERKNDHNRMESLRHIVHDLARWFLMLAGVIVTVGILFWSWHLLLPEELWFLSGAQRDRIQTILTTILFSGLVGGYARRVMDSRNSSTSK